MYAAAIVLWELLTGRQLFPPSKNREHDLLARALSPQQVRPSGRVSTMLAELDEICLKALAPRRDDRYADCDAMCTALQAWLTLYAPATSRMRLADFMQTLFAEDIERQRTKRADWLRALSSQ
jgi:serine/threonine-protein kinase